MEFIPKLSVLLKLHVWCNKYCMDRAETHTTDLFVNTLNKLLQNC
jgi:hypothetical protein